MELVHRKMIDHNGLKRTKFDSDGFKRTVKRHVARYNN